MVTGLGGPEYSTVVVSVGCRYVLPECNPRSLRDGGLGLSIVTATGRQAEPEHTGLDSSSDLKSLNSDSMIQPNERTAVLFSCRSVAITCSLAAVPRVYQSAVSWNLAAST